MHKWALVTSIAFILGGACKMQDDDADLANSSCAETVTTCRLNYSPFNGYQRACDTRCEEQISAPNRPSDDDRRSRDADASDAPPSEAPAAAAPQAPAGDALGPATPLDVTRYSAFDIPCARDNQCGPGKCVAGNCYYGCQSDLQCGSGDRCSQESGARICQPDPNPPVACTRSAQCNEGFVCLNGACRQECTSTEQCSNALDRCGSGVCVPDRRPIAECVLNSECGAGEVCLDGACVSACANASDAGVCLSEPAPVFDEPPASVPAAPEPDVDAPAAEPPAAEEEPEPEPEPAPEEQPEEPEAAPTDAGLAPQDDIR